MPPRGSEGLDFTPILTNYLILGTTLASAIAWLVAFIGQIVTNVKFGRGAVSTLWFAIFLQLFLIVGVVYTLASDSIAMNRAQIYTFGAVAIVFAVTGTDRGLFVDSPGPNAMGAGWLILSIIDIIWVLFFTSEEDSLFYHFVMSFGTGGLTPPSRRRRARPQSNMNMSAAPGYSTQYAGGGISNTDVVYDKPAGGLGPSSLGTGMRSQHSFTNPGSAPNSVHNAPIGGAGSIGGDAPHSPLMASPVTGGPGSQSGDAMQSPESYSYKAKALYAYTASPDDPNEISFTKGEILDIVDKQGKWWQAKKSDGTIGIAPSNYLQII